MAEKFGKFRHRWLRAVMARPDLSSLAKSVAYFLIEYANRETGKCFPRMTTLATDASAHRQSIQRTIATLERHGFLRVERTVGRGKSNEYFFIIPPLENATARLPFSTAVTPPVTPAEKATVEDKRQHLDPEKATARLPQLLLSTSSKIQTIPSSQTAPPSGGACSPLDLDKEEANVGNQLGGFEGWMKKHQGKRRLAPDELRYLEQWAEFCEQTADAYSYHDGNGVGGRAYRLAQDAHALLDSGGTEP